jgi:hypothetical protein
MNTTLIRRFPPAWARADLGALSSFSVEKGFNAVFSQALYAKLAYVRNAI